MEERKKESIGFATIHPDNIRDLCVTYLKKNGIQKSLQSRALGDMPNAKKIIHDKLELSSNFDKPKIELTWTELLSMGLIAKWFQWRERNANRYSIGVQLDDTYLKEKELFLSDGVLIRNPDNIKSWTPFQQVIAQNVVGKNKGRGMQSEIIEQVNKKIARRKSYNKLSGLIISVIPGDVEGFDMYEVVQKCDMRSFIPTFMIVYENDFKRCRIFYLSEEQTYERVKRDMLGVDIYS